MAAEARQDPESVLAGSTSDETPAGSQPREDATRLAELERKARVAAGEPDIEDLSGLLRVKAILTLALRSSRPRNRVLSSVDLTITEHLLSSDVRDLITRKCANPPTKGAAVIERLLPASVVAVETFTDVSGEEPHPGEADLVSRAVEARRREFITARRCAREALSALGHHTVAIRSGQHREPIWPTGFVGSITHCAGYRGAAVARAGEPAAVGIDAEPHDSLPHAVARLIVGEQNAWLRELTQAAPATHWDRVLFSIKESAFKAWFPLTGRWLGFDDVVVSVVPNAGLFRAQVLIDGARIDGGPPLTQMQGRFIVDGGLVLTAAIVEA